MDKVKYKRRDEIEAELKKLQKDYTDLEYKFSCVLDKVTGGCIGKPHTDKALIDEAVHKQVIVEWESAVIDYKENQEELKNEK